MSLAPTTGEQLALFTFEQLEEVIERGLRTFVEVGTALLRIRDEQLYRQRGYEDFDTYCRGRWGWQRTRAEQHISAAKVALAVTNVTPDLPPPANEGQARELVPLMREAPEQVAQVWRELRDRHGDRITADKIREAVGSTLRREDRQAAKAEHVAQIAARPIPTVAGPFEVLYVDPPWRYEHAPDDTRAIENHYPTMRLDEIKALKVPAADHAVLFLWATSPKLAEALEVMAAWRFDYRTSLVWVKDRIGMGYYIRGQHELLLVGKRGDLPVPEPSDRPASVIHAPRLEHSAKPEVVYQLLERMYPTRTLVELFARQSRPGWAAWGNQAEAVA